MPPPGWAPAHYIVQKRRLKGRPHRLSGQPGVSKKRRKHGDEAQPCGRGKAWSRPCAGRLWFPGGLQPTSPQAPSRAARRIHAGEGQVWSRENSPDANKNPRGSARALRGATQPVGSDSPVLARSPSAAGGLRRGLPQPHAGSEVSAQPCGRSLQPQAFPFSAAGARARSEAREPPPACDGS